MSGGCRSVAAMDQPPPHALPVGGLRTAAGRLPGPGGVLVGHADAVGDGWRTGCTVVLPPPGTVGAVAVGGGAPGTRETDALAPGTLVSTVDALLLSGGSAFGLSAADGVLRWCEAAGRGFVVTGGDASAVVRVPIVPAAVVFDLGRGGDVTARPDARFGWAACAATEAVPSHDDADDDEPDEAGQVPEGAVGAGAGCLVSAGTAPSGVGTVGGPVAGTAHRLGALVVANAAGTPIGRPAPTAGPDGAPGLLNTTLVVVVTDALLDVAAAHRLAQAAHAGLARAVDPSHTLVDGDVVFALATGRGTAPEDVRARVALETAAAHAVTDAFARAVGG